ncbi:hypothetical protein HaLaN_08998 [Haematococcus lacustris]|uniref:Uncharacterized protein n=1 Tax=Haematococcus lacustris TaxID=44745 RepID=A0A699YSH4_HAELA|nr:hypothetical protein HaLaN_08998 [Haematococcus lacustris]
MPASLTSLLVQRLSPDLLRAQSPTQLTKLVEAVDRLQGLEPSLAHSLLRLLWAEQRRFSFPQLTSLLWTVTKETGANGA